MKIKRLCDLSKKDIEKHWDQIAEMLKTPTHACLNCCRVSDNKKRLCKPQRLSDPPNQEAQP